MPTRDTRWPEGTPNWADISVPDIDAALKFYGPVIGWTFSDSGEEFGHYQTCQVDGRDAAGIGPKHAADQPTVWTIYLASNDADATAKLIADNGGTVLVEPFDIGEVGRIAIALDNTGGAFGVFQGKQSIGFQVIQEPGAMVWEDARLTDVPAGRRFYSAVFGYQYGEVPGIPIADYATFAVRGEVVGGMGVMMGAPEGTPSHWMPYFGVADVDASVAAAQRGGGNVIAPAEDTPFGRMATLTDMFGAAFAVHQPLPEQR
jgi:predicted enzyme related to lactoylglutathione lyase